MATLMFRALEHVFVKSLLPKQAQTAQTALIEQEAPKVNSQPTAFGVLLVHGSLYCFRTTGASLLKCL